MGVRTVLDTILDTEHLDWWTWTVTDDDKGIWKALEFGKLFSDEQGYELILAGGSFGTEIIMAATETDGMELIGHGHGSRRRTAVDSIISNAQRVFLSPAVNATFLRW